MSATQANHPTQQALHEYGLGKLDDASSNSVNKHLETCPVCRQRVAELTSDSFLGRLREARDEQGAPAPLISSTAGPSMLDGGAISPASPPASSLPPGLAGHPGYEVLRELGQGGMGVVYLAENRLMGRMEVLKIVGSHLINRRGVLDRFLCEIRNAAQLHHSNVVTAYSASRLGESLMLAMEYVEGLDLSRLVKAKGPLPVAKACSYISQAALGLQHAHEHGMVHRDIKPSNLMLARQGNRAVIKVLDFGLAKIQSERPADGALTHEGQMLGTPDYIAPEQISDARRADVRADIYSLGCTLYYLLTGGPPFQGTSLYDILQAHHSMEAMLLNLVRPEVPVDLAALVAKMMAKEPKRRFQQPKDVAQALRPFCQSTSVGPVGPTAELSQLDQPAPAREPKRPGSVSARSAIDVDVKSGPVLRRPAGPSRFGLMGESPIELLEAEHGPEALSPRPNRRGPRARFPLIAAAVLLGALSWAAMILVRKPASPPEPGRGLLIADVPKVLDKTIQEAPATRSPATAIADSGARYGLRFDPARNAFIRVNKLKYNGSHPITLEAYVRPLADANQNGTIISDAEGAGVEMGIRPGGKAFLIARSGGKYREVVSREPLIGKRSHLAGVFDGGRLSLFVDGKRESALDVPGPFKSSPLPFYVGGNPNVDGSAAYLFNGIIEQVRISNSARYHGDFDPEERLGADANALLLYHFERDTDNFVVDASGHGHDGLIQGAELILLVDAPLRERSPVADGTIGDGEYGPPMKVDFTSSRNPGRLIVLQRKGREWSETVPHQDLSFTLHAAHTDRSLFLAFLVTDDFIDDEEEEKNQIFLNDCVEVFIDGDRVPNDYGVTEDRRRFASREGFQILCDALGRQRTFSDDFSNSDWKVAATRLSDGYVLEFEVPLDLIDTGDGARSAPAATGSFLWFNAGVIDNDSTIHGQEDYGVLWLTGPPGARSSPAFLGEKGWRVGLFLSGPRAGGRSARSGAAEVRRVPEGNTAAVSRDRSFFDVPRNGIPD